MSETRKTPNRRGPLLLLSLCAALAGCSGPPESHPDISGPMPTAPPAGSAHAPAAPAVAPDAFVARLQAASHDDRATLMRDNAQTVTAIMAGPDSPAKQKLTALINQH